ncbi:MAG: hypothetical protein O6916_03370, partial [bacterium]|nr:hypothetical protein [bacterium]
MPVIVVRYDAQRLRGLDPQYRHHYVECLFGRLQHGSSPVLNIFSVVVDGDQPGRNRLPVKPDVVV